MQQIEPYRQITYIYEDCKTQIFTLDLFLSWFQKYNLELIQKKNECFNEKQKKYVSDHFLHFLKLFKIFLKNVKQFTYNGFKNKYFQNEEIHLFSTIKFLFLEKINICINEYIVEYKQLIKQETLKNIDDYINNLLEKELNKENKKDLKEILNKIKLEYEVNSYIDSIQNLIFICFAKYQIDFSFTELKKKLEEALNVFQLKNKTNSDLIESLIFSENEKERKINEKKQLSKKREQERKIQKIEKEREKKKEIFYYKQKNKLLKYYFTLFLTFKNKSKKSKYIIYAFIKDWINYKLYIKQLNKVTVNNANIIIQWWRNIYLKRKESRKKLILSNIKNRMKVLLYSYKIYNFIYNNYFLKNLKIGDKVIINVSGFLKTSTIDKKQLSIISIDTKKRNATLELKNGKLNVVYKNISIKSIFKINKIN